MLLVDADARRVFLDGQEVVLGRREYQVLEYLVSQRGALRNLDQLAARAWGDCLEGVSNGAICTTIWRLRQKLPREYIKRRRGLGYFVPVELT